MNDDFRAADPEDFWTHVHEVIGSMDDEERGFYKGFVEASFYAAADQVFEISIDPKVPMYVYHSGGQIKDPEHPFYSPTPPRPEGTKEVFFDPEKFLALLAESDREAALYYARFDVSKGPYSHYFIIQLACTEGTSGVPWDNVGWCDFEAAKNAWETVKG